MSFGGSTGVSKGDQDLGLFSGTLRAAYVLGTQREGSSHERSSASRRSATHVRRQRRPVLGVWRQRVSRRFDPVGKA